MPFAAQHIQSAAGIIDAYDGSLPLQHYLKQYFAAHKKFGSKDRKAITHACYCYYRLGGALQQLSLQERIRIAIFLCTADAANWAEVFTEDWLQHWSADLQERLYFIGQQYPFDINQVFPLHPHLDDSIDKQAFLLSHLVQPDLFLRTRPGKNIKVKQVLHQAGVAFQSCGESCIALPNTTRINELIQLNKDAVVQDLSSQQIAGYLSLLPANRSSWKVWDCCAASGGKSILATDVLSEINLTVSDIRPSILQNLAKRFSEAGIVRYNSLVADLSTAKPAMPRAFDLVICDVPCSGSGTWSRTPEQLAFFTEDRINYYSSLQKKICSNVIPAVGDNGYLLYITCSVFTEENESMVDFILTNSGLQLQQSGLIKGYDQKADTMFAALFTASPL